MIVNVTEDDIIKGWRSDCSFCPIALALKRSFPDKKVTVFPEHVFLDAKAFRLPIVAQAFISQFDMGIPVKPISFELL